MTTFTHPVPAVRAAASLPPQSASRCAGEHVLCDQDGAEMVPAGGARVWCPRCGREIYGPESPGCPLPPIDTISTPSGLVAVCSGHRRPGVQLWRHPDEP